MINKKDVSESQKKWALDIINIGKAKNDFTRAQELTQAFLENQYDFKIGNVQFKPTKASLHQFRNDISSATSYFIGGNKSFEEDSGFALTPWSEVKFVNDSIQCHDNIASAMGNYFFKDSSKNEIKVEYTFVYIKRGDGNIKIILHHSSLPYNSNF
tara:strand:+ start:33 stop:500 length:468 start_codon:yes stop_codon:yes gene_type:complete